MIAKLLEKFAQLNQHEKRMVGLAILVIAWAIWDKWLYQPLQQQKIALQQELSNLSTQIAAQQQARLTLQRRDPTDPNATAQQKLLVLKTDYARLQAQLMSGEKKFVPPSQMAKALSDVLNQNQRLTLIALKTLPLSTLLSHKEQQQPIYKHGLAISFSGHYLDTLNYLTALEALPWHIIWDSIDYQVTHYPLAEVTIQVYTLSFEETWLNV